MGFLFVPRGAADQGQIRLPCHLHVLSQCLRYWNEKYCSHFFDLERSRISHEKFSE